MQIIQEFIDMQLDNGWAVEYAIIEDDEEEEEEDEPTTVSTYVITKIED